MLEYEVTTLYLGGKELKAKIADNTSKRAKGLSKSEPLQKNECMLFIFDFSAKYPVWMRGMNFPIDILWLDNEKKIVDIKSNLKPAKHILDFTAYSPENKAKYAIELRAGFVKANKISKSSAVKF